MPTHHQGKPAEVRALNAYIKFMRAGEALGARLLQAHTLGALTISQFAVLEALYHLGPLQQSVIGTKTLRSPGNITLVIDNLQKAGLVTRTRSAEDRRAVVVALTAKGRRRIANILPQHFAAIVAQMSVLTPEEQQTFGELCRKLGKGEGASGG